MWELNSGQAELRSENTWFASLLIRVRNVGRLSADDQPETIDLETHITCTAEWGAKYPTITELRGSNPRLTVTYAQSVTIFHCCIVFTERRIGLRLPQQWWKSGPLNNLFTFRNAHTCLWAGVAQSVFLINDWTTGVQTPAKGKDFSSSLCIQTSSEPHPASLSSGYQRYLPSGGKVRPEHDADNSPPLVPKSMSSSYTPLPLCACMACMK
jgi:hypothetical protein